MDNMGQNEFMGISLFFTKRRAELYSVFSIRNSDGDGCLAGAQRHGCHHQTRITKYHVRLLKALTRNAPDQILDRYKDIRKC